MGWMVPPAQLLRDHGMDGVTSTANQGQAVTVPMPRLPSDTKSFWES